MGGSDDTPVTDDVPADGNPDDIPYAGVADDALVRLDRLGSVPVPTMSGLLLAPGLPEASRLRLLALGGDRGALELTDDLQRVSEARLVLVSTRIPRAELTALLARIQDVATCPVIALVHTGGESLSVEVVRRGGAGVVAEGNEGAVAAFLTGEPAASGLLDSYDRHVARADTAAHSSRGRDAVTGLPDRTSLEVRLAALEQEGEVPRLALVRVVHTPLVPEELGEDAANLVRRRLATQFLHVARAHDAAIFTLGPWDFALVAVGLSPNAAQYLGRDLDRIAETYAPAGVDTLGIAMGHAGPEVSTDVPALREAAQRALDAAVSDRSAVVVSADSLSLGVSATTELEAALRIVEHVDRQSGHPGAGARVGELASLIATELGYDGIARSRIQLAGHLHGVGMASLPAEALTAPERLTGELLEAYRQYPVRSAAYVTVSAGPEVATAVRSHRERWDGAGFPDGLVGADTPVSARIVATARAMVELCDTGSPRAEECIAALRARAGSELDPDMVAVAVELVDELIGAAFALAG